ncbi:hypothetical protein ACFFGT_13040 [Mucilaginibacter angelicae]|uniref:Uncharacterized protein n=1 Tax=Mucilaginibacter angelicae TaxID=869718 RepID=A0ABV6L6S1_9SPHI
MSDSTKGLVKGSIGDEWKKYFAECLQSEIDSKASYVSMANTDGPGVLIDTKLGLSRKNIKNVVPANVYQSLIDVAGNTPECSIKEDDYRLIGGFFKVILFNLLKINAGAESTKLDTIVFNVTSYKKISLKGDVLDSLYNARESNAALKSFFDDFSKKKVSLIIKGYVISGFSADIKFKKLDTVGLTAAMDSGLVKNTSAGLGFKFKKGKNNHITASSAGDFIPLVQYARLKDIKD